MTDFTNAMSSAAAGATGNVTEADLVACVPNLRSFATSLTRNRESADDLLQETVLRALTSAHRFQAGTNLKAWMFAILRNVFYTELRKNRIRVQSLDEATADEPTVLPSQEASLEFGEFRRAFQQLGEDQRTALILVGANGLSYAEGAKMCGCATGTMKSRVSRARRELRRMLDDGSPAEKRRYTPALPGHIRDLRDSGRGYSPAALAW